MDVSEPVCVAAAVAVGDDEHQLQAGLPPLAPRPLRTTLEEPLPHVLEPESPLKGRGPR